MLTRTPEQVALSETSRLCQQIMDLCTDAATQTSDDDLRRLMVRLTAEHQTVLERVNERIRATGDLPRMPDPELENVKELATRVKKIFAADDRTVLLEERIAQEQELLSQISDGLDEELSPETRACLEDAQRTATRALRALEEARESSGG